MKKRHGSQSPIWKECTAHVLLDLLAYSVKLAWRFAVWALLMITTFATMGMNV